MQLLDIGGDWIGFLSLFIVSLLTHSSTQLRLETQVKIGCLKLKIELTYFIYLLDIGLYMVSFGSMQLTVWWPLSSIFGLTFSLLHASKFITTGLGFWFFGDETINQQAFYLCLDQTNSTYIMFRAPIQHKALENIIYYL